MASSTSERSVPTDSIWEKDRRRCRKLGKKRCFYVHSLAVIHQSRSFDELREHNRANDSSAACESSVYNRISASIRKFSIFVLAERIFASAHSTTCATGISSAPKLRISSWQLGNCEYAWDQQNIRPSGFLIQPISLPTTEESFK